MCGSGEGSGELERQRVQLVWRAARLPAAELQVPVVVTLHYTVDFLSKWEALI